MYRTWPAVSSTRRSGSDATPCRGSRMRAYAAVSDCSVTSPDPSASDGTLGHVADAHVLGVLAPSAECRPAAAANGGAVARRPERRAQIHGLGGRVLVVRRPVRPAASRPRSFRWSRIVAGRVPGLERRGVDERLERRAWLAARLHGAVEAALREVASADHRAHVARAWIHRDQRGLQRGRIARRACGLRASASRFSSRAFSDCATDASAASCSVHVDRRVDAETALVDLLPAEALDELLPHLFLEVLTARVARRGGCRAARRARCARAASPGDR